MRINVRLSPSLGRLQVVQAKPFENSCQERFRRSYLREGGLVPAYECFLEQIFSVCAAAQNTLGNREELSPLLCENREMSGHHRSTPSLKGSKFFRLIKAPIITAPARIPVIIPNFAPLLNPRPFTFVTSA